MRAPPNGEARTTSCSLFGNGEVRPNGELVFVDLVQGDRQGLVVDAGVHQGAAVVEQAAFVEVSVVVVDLAGALRGEDHERVLGVDLRQQFVDGRVDDAEGLCGEGGGPCFGG